MEQDDEFMFEYYKKTNKVFHFIEEKKLCMRTRSAWDEMKIPNLYRSLFIQFHCCTEANVLCTSYCINFKFRYESFYMSVCVWSIKCALNTDFCMCTCVCKYNWNVNSEWTQTGMRQLGSGNTKTEIIRICCGFRSENPIPATTLWNCEHFSKFIAVFAVKGAWILFLLHTLKSMNLALCQIEWTIWFVWF